MSAFVAEAWHETTTDQINDETGELRVHWPALQTARHRVLDASHYRFLEPPPATAVAAEMEH